MELAAADFRLRGEHANLGHEIVADLALDRERGVEVDRRPRALADRRVRRA